MARDLIPGDATIKAVRPGDPRKRLSDGGGLYLLLFVKGGAHGWRLDYSHGGKRKTLSLGTYPDTGLALARRKADDARRLLAEGIDPSEARQADKQRAARQAEALALAEAGKPGPGTFEHLAREWLAQVHEASVSPGHAERTRIRFERDAFPYIGRRQVAEIEAPELLRTMDGYAGHPVTRAALALSALLMLRPGELRQAEWTWVDLDAAAMTVPAALMKRRKAEKLNGTPHLVPLAPQAVAILLELHELTGQGRYCFPALHTAKRPMSENTINTALRRMGFDRDTATAHGFRAMARTLAAERLGVVPEVIEAQLAHTVGDALGRAYNRTTFVQQRRELMTRWADYLDRLRKGADVVPLPERAAQR